jgi:aminoglycoside 6-adenylyltransferase
MRSEKEMMDLILGFAKSDERIRLVGMEGSRLNPHVPKDKYQDYDISFLVTEMESFKASDSWLDYFGKWIFMQKPEAMSLFPHELGNWFSYLMLFSDGNRIDLTLIPLEELELYLQSDKLLKILLDKDDLVKYPPAPTDQDYHVQKPSAAFFDDCCNEFWWVSTYVSKGLWRREFLYAIEHFHNYVRKSLLRMLSWKVGIDTGFSLSVGKSYKYLNKYLPPKTWKDLLAIYQNGSFEELWEALFASFRLFREASREVSERLSYPYPDYDEQITAFIEKQYREYLQY